MTEVRWKRPGIEHSWRYGTIRDMSESERLEIWCAKGGMYSIHRKHVQVQVRGPRGGVSWRNA